MDKQQFKDAIFKALPEEVAQHDGRLSPRAVFLPKQHHKALQPNNSIVVGMRGAGKSFWFTALSDEPLRIIISKQLGSNSELNENTSVSVGFSPSFSRDYPDKDTLSGLIRQDKQSRDIWRAVLFQRMAKELNIHAFAEISTWNDKVEWLINHPEEFSRVVLTWDEQLKNEDRFHLFLFDGLDRTANDWHSLNKITKGILEVALDMRTTKRIRLKIFARPDQLKDKSVLAFPDSSKLLQQQVPLEWSRDSLYSLLWQYLLNDDATRAPFKQLVNKIKTIDWRELDDIHLVPVELQSDDDLIHQTFNAIAGEWMGRGPKKGKPYTWLPNHLADAEGKVSPRSFLSAVKYAAEFDFKAGQNYSLHFDGIKAGVQKASSIRVDELQEDYPWIQSLIEPLRGLVVPCESAEIKERWERAGTLKSLTTVIADSGVRLPPEQLDQGPVGVINDLCALGICERLNDGRINLPDVYRVGYGLGRKGGVKPVR